VKICPTQAIEVRGYADFVPLGASVTAMRSTEDIMWTVQFRNKDIRPSASNSPFDGASLKAKRGRSTNIQPRTPI